jgi:hypothetical protein
VEKQKAFLQAYLGKMGGKYEKMEVMERMEKSRISGNFAAEGLEDIARLDSLKIHNVATNGGFLSYTKGGKWRKMGFGFFINFLNDFPVPNEFFSSGVSPGGKIVGGDSPRFWRLVTRLLFVSAVCA